MGTDMGLVTKMHHVAIRYADPEQYERAVSFYSDVSG